MSSHAPFIVDLDKPPLPPPMRLIKEGYPPPYNQAELDAWDAYRKEYSRQLDLKRKSCQ